MKREDLEKLGLEKAVVDKIMDYHGDSIEVTKKELQTTKDALVSKTRELDTVTKANKEFQNSIKKYEGIDVDKLNIDIKKLNDENEEMKAKHAEELAAKDKAYAIDKLFADKPLASELARKAAIVDFTEKNLTFDKGVFYGAEGYFKALKESDPAACYNLAKILMVAKQDAH